MPRTPYENSKRTNNGSGKREDSKRKSFRKRAQDAPTYDNCNPLLLAGIVCLCTTHNASPTFSYTRDGTALCVAVFYDGERYVDYLADTNELAEWFEWLTTELLPCTQSDLEPYALIAPVKP